MTARCARFLAPLSKLETARDAVSRVANDPEKLDEALSNLETTFTGITRQSATRNACEMYAARTMVYEDCRRDLALEDGPKILEELGPPLSLLLTSVRWLTSKIAEGYRKLCNQIYLELSQERGTPVIEAAEFMHRVIPFLAEADTLFMGPTSGAAFMVARWWAEKNPDANVVVLFPDEGYRYQETVYNDEWLRLNAIPPRGLTKEPRLVTHPSEAGPDWSHMYWGNRAYEDVLGTTFQPEGTNNESLVCVY
jgi:hypothetical protein